MDTFLISSFTEHETIVIQLFGLFYFVCLLSAFIISIIKEESKFPRYNLPPSIPSDKVKIFPSCKANFDISGCIKTDCCNCQFWRI